MTSIYALSPKTMINRSLRYVAIGAVALGVYFGGSYLWGLRKQHLAKKDAQFKERIFIDKANAKIDFHTKVADNKKKEIFRTVDSGDYDSVPQKIEEYSKLELVGVDKVDLVKQESKQRASDSVGSSVNAKIKEEDYKSAREILDRFARSQLSSPDQVSRLNYAVDEINPTNILAWADSAQKLSFKITLYRKAEDGFAKLGVPLDGVRNKIVSTQLESILSLSTKDYEPDDYQEEVYAKLCQLKTYLSTRTEFKPKLSNDLIDRLFGTSASFAVSSETPVQGALLIDKIGEVYSLFAATNANEIVRGLADRFVSSNIDRMKQIKSKEFGAMGSENLQAAVTVNEKYSVGKGAEILSVCMRVIKDLDNSSGLKPKLVRLVGNRINWIPESQRKEIMDQISYDQAVSSEKVESK